MTVQLDVGQLLGALASAAVAPVVAVVVAEWRRDRRNAIADALRARDQVELGERVGKLEGFLGVDDPEDAAFMRARDGRRIEHNVREILDRLGNGKPGQFVHVERFEAHERVAIADHGAIRELRGVVIEHAGQIGTLRRDVDGLMER